MVVKYNMSSLPPLPEEAAIIRAPVVVTIVSQNNDFANLATDILSRAKPCTTRPPIKIYRGSIKSYIPRQERTNIVYVCPSSSLGFMDNDVNIALHSSIFPGIGPVWEAMLQYWGKPNLAEQRYLPIGSSMIVPGLPLSVGAIKGIGAAKASKRSHRYLCMTPIMLLPQNIEETQNCYYATMAAMSNVMRHHKFSNVEVIFTPMCCEYGGMSIRESWRQMMRGLADYPDYDTKFSGPCNLNEANLDEQPTYPQNYEWMPIEPRGI